MPIILTVKATGQGDYSVCRDGTVLCTGRHALSSSLWLLQFEGIAMDTTVVVRNADTGAESPSFALRQYRDVRREGGLPLPETRRERMRRCRAIRKPAWSGEPLVEVPRKLPNLPPIGGRKWAVWTDQRAKVRTCP